MQNFIIHLDLAGWASLSSPAALLISLPMLFAQAGQGPPDMGLFSNSCQNARLPYSIFNK